MTEILVDIAICTYNRASYVANALRLLLPQLPVDGRVGVMVVDNNCSDDTATQVATLQQQWPLLRYERCRVQGLGHARNHALAATSAPWLAFLDDDAEPADDWVAQLLRLIDDGQFDAFGGVYYAWFAEGQVPWFKPHYASNDSVVAQGDEFRLTSGYFSGGIAAYRAELLRQAGGFPTSLGMHGVAIGYGEETAAQRRMAIAGGRLGFSRRWTMRHLVPLRKQRWQWEWQRQFALGRDFWAIFDKPAQPATLWLYLKIEVRQCLQVTGEALRRFWQQGRWQNLAFETARWARSPGLVWGYRGRRLSARQHAAQFSGADSTGKKGPQ
ncbi:MAG: glycosyltransferase family 2 protein [Gammaproteobacteria bacterium]|nr:glycosyltransferase family 2 protein [Gammaproteobacteria bacterium]